MSDGNAGPLAKGAHCSWQGNVISLEKWLESGIGWDGKVWQAGTITVNIWHEATHELVRTMWFDNQAVFNSSEPENPRLGLPPGDFDGWHPGAWAPDMPAVRH